MDQTLYQSVARPGKAGAYATTMYGRGWRLWEALRLAMGDEAFTRMVRGFYTRHQFGVAT